MSFCACCDASGTNVLLSHLTWNAAWVISWICVTASQNAKLLSSLQTVQAFPQPITHLTRHREWCPDCCQLILTRGGEIFSQGITGEALSYVAAQSMHIVVLGPCTDVFICYHHETKLNYDSRPPLEGKSVQESVSNEYQKLLCSVPTATTDSQSRNTALCIVASAHAFPLENWPLSAPGTWTRFPTPQVSQQRRNGCKCWR
jgi:hypothetical protein